MGTLPALVRPRGPIFVAHKSDPFFVVFPHQPIPDPSNIFVDNKATPVRIFQDEVVTAPVAPPQEVREQPLLRVSGIMTGDGVYAILEKSDGEAQVVKPGDEVSVPLPGGGQAKRTYRIISISGTGVKMQAKEDNVTYTQLVELSGQSGSAE